MVSSAVRCRLPTVPLRRPSPTAFSEFVCPTPDSRSLTHFRSCRRSRAQAFVWFRAKTGQGIVCLADHPYSVTLDWTLLYWPFLHNHAVLQYSYSGPYSALLLLLDRGRLWVSAHPHPSAQALTEALFDWQNFFWLHDWDWPLFCEDLCIYNFMPTHFWFNPRVAYTYASLPFCLHRCVLQSVRLHSWNNRPCQGQYATHTHFPQL